MKNAKAKGSKNEHKAMRLLEASGYYCTRAGASLGIFDIVAIGKQGVRLVQVKSNRTASPIEREQITLFDNVPPNTTKELWIYKDYARQPIIKLL